MHAQLLLGGTLLAGSVAPRPAAAQADTTTQAANVWLVYNGVHRVSSRFALLAEGQLRRTDGASAPKQLLLRPALRYAWREGATVAAGYAYLRTSPYGVFSEPVATSEHRAWEQLAVETQAGRVALEHRLRVEQRWQAEVASGGRAYTNRVRYRLAATRPLHAGTEDAPGWYLTAAEEPFVRFGAHARGRALDQNRASLGVGHRWPALVSFEANYLNQYDLQPSGRGRAISHVLYLVVGVTAPLTHRGAP